MTGIQNLMKTDMSGDAFPSSEVSNIQTYDVAYSLVELPPKILLSQILQEDSHTDLVMVINILWWDIILMAISF